MCIRNILVFLFTGFALLKQSDGKKIKNVKQLQSLISLLPKMSK